MSGEEEGTDDLGVMGNSGDVADVENVWHPHQLSDYNRNWTTGRTDLTVSVNSHNSQPSDERVNRVTCVTCMASDACVTHSSSQVL